MLQVRQQLRQSLAPVVGVVASLGRPDLKVMQQFARMARIFSGDQRDVLQGVDRPKRHIRQVANRSADDIERAIAIEIRHRCVVLLAVLQNKPSRSGVTNNG